MKDDWALCVGIQHYSAESKLAELPGAIRDAEAIHAWLLDQAGGEVPAPQAKLIRSTPESDDQEPSPTANAIEAFLRSLYRRATASSAQGNGFRAGRRLWLFYSGHGLGFLDDPQDNGLLTADAFPPNDLPHVAGRAWAELFAISAAFEEVVLFMDCCRTEANRISLRRPALKQMRADPPGRMLVAYAVAETRAAFEIASAGGPRGKFSLALEELLRNPPRRPLRAREFSDLLCQRHSDTDPYPPRSPKEDFDLLAGVALAAAARPAALVAHGESTHHLAGHIAGAFSPPALVRWAPQVPGMAPEELDPVEELVVTRNVGLSDLEELVARVKPCRTVLFAEKDPGVTSLRNVRFVPRPPADQMDPGACVGLIKTELAGLRGTLTVEAQESLALVRVWDLAGRMVGQGYGQVTLGQLPVGPYRARASLGAHHAEGEAEVTAQKEVRLSLPPLAIPLRLDREIAQLAPAAAGAPRRRAVRLALPGGALMLSLPEVPGWTTEVHSTGRGAAGLSVRMIPPGHPAAAPLPTDTLRESLRLALSAPHWAAAAPTVKELGQDPIAALLAAALRLRTAAPGEEHLQLAASILGDDDVDVTLLRGGARVCDVPLLVAPWQQRLQEGTLEVEGSSLADGLVGRLRLAGPWLAWDPDQAERSAAWLAQVATAAWPGWNVEPDADFALEQLDAAAVSLGAPPSSVRARAYKAPPVDRLVQHTCVAFVGASNDQLPAALAVAFVARGRQRWQRLDVWSLSDELLTPMTSLGRTGPRLLAARDQAERQLRQLLPLVAEAWSLERYDGWSLANRVTFASLWDWTKPGGFVHLSAREVGADVRTSAAEEFAWSDSAPRPPVRFAEAAQAYDAFCKRRMAPPSR